MTTESAPKTDTKANDKAEKPDKPDKPVPLEVSIETTHEIQIDGVPRRYVATVATTHLANEDGDPVGEIFHTVYTLGEIPNPARPITFCFNGGPGSASAWLHLGAWGPMRIDLPDPHFPPPPPYRLIPNAETLLGFTDLVFVDPVGTGLSRPVGKGKLEDFTGVAEDLASMSEFIRLFLTKHGRWNAPRFLAGESYGGTRVAGLSGHLFDRGIMLNGIILVSAALDLQHLEFQIGNDLPNALFLPSYAAIAAYHGVLAEKPADHDALLREVRAFAIDEYLPALVQGSGLDEERRARIVEKLARFTGLPPAWILQNDLRLVDARVLKEMLRSRGLSVGRLDARYVGPEADLGSSEMVADPSYAAAGGAFTALINDYLRGPLGVTDPREYKLLNMKVNAAWKWPVPSANMSGGYVNVVKELRRAMLASPHLHVLFCNGLFDLATPFFANEIASRHLGREASIVAHVRTETYAAGHMMYFHAGARAKLTADIAAFVRAATSRA